MITKNNLLFSLISTITILGISSCSKESISDLQSNEIESVIFKADNFKNPTIVKTNVDITDNGASFIWDTNDTIGIFPTEGAQTYFAIEEGANGNTASFNGGGWALKVNSNYYAYYPFSTDNFKTDKSILNNIPVSFLNQNQNGDNNKDNIGNYDFMYASTETPNDGSVTFNFSHLVALVQINLTIPEPDTFSKITLSSETNDFIETGTYDITTENSIIKGNSYTSSLSMYLSDITTTEANQKIILYMILPPADFSTKNLNLILEGTTSAYKGTIVEKKNFEAGYFYKLTNTFTKSLNNKEINIATAGSLSSLIPDNEKALIENLTLTGELNGLDVRTINTLTNLKYLDMSGLKIITDQNPYYIEKGVVYHTIENVFPSLFSYNSDLMKNLKSIIFPNSVKEIGDRAFCVCTALTSITIPNGVTSIGSRVFPQCIALTSIAIPNSVISIGNDAFCGCTALTSITIPNSVTSIGDEAFAYCNALNSITISNGVTSIGSRVFRNSYALTSITIPNGVTSIGSCAFLQCTALTSITIPNSVTSIKNDAFAYDENIKEIHIKIKVPIKAPSFSCNYFVCKLYVPKGSVDLYKESSDWSAFQNIIGE